MGGAPGEFGLDDGLDVGPDIGFAGDPNVPDCPGWPVGVPICVPGAPPTIIASFAGSQINSNCL